MHSSKANQRASVALMRCGLVLQSRVIGAGRMTGSRLKVYVNGILAATTLYPFKAEAPRPELYLGNTAMAFADLAIYDTELPAEEIAASYAGPIAPKNPAIQAELRELFTVTPKPPVD